MAITIGASRQLGRMRRKAAGKPLAAFAVIKDGVIVGYEDRTAQLQAAARCEQPAA